MRYLEGYGAMTKPGILGITTLSISSGEEMSLVLIDKNDISMQHVALERFEFN